MTAPSTSTAFRSEHFGGIPSSFESVVTNPNSSDVSTTDTIALMTRYARDHVDSHQVQEAVHRATSFLPAKAPPAEVVQSIYDWVKNNVRFITDEEVLMAVFGKGPDAELVLTPPRLLTMPVPMGDCDCISTLLASMLIASGADVGVSFTTVAVDDKEPDRFSHVYVIATLPCGQEIPLDASHGPEMGWEVNGIYRKQVYEVSRAGECSGGNGKMIQTLGGLDGIDWGELLTTGVQTTSDIFKARYAVPPPSYRQTPEGEIVVRGSQAGITAGIMPPIQGLGTYLLLGGAALLVVMMMRR